MQKKKWRERELDIITHLMKRLYAEGTLCLFSGAGYNTDKLRSLSQLLMNFLSLFLSLPVHLYMIDPLKKF
jgi:hypothetical protein